MDMSHSEAATQQAAPCHVCAQVPLPFHFLPNTYLLPGGTMHRPPPQAVLRAFQEVGAALDCCF